MSVMDEVNASLNAGNLTSEDLLKQIAKAYGTDTTAAQMSSYDARMAKQKEEDIGKLRGIQQEYGMAGSGQEFRDLGTLLSDYGTNRAQYAADLETQQNQQMQQNLGQLYNIQKGIEETTYNRKEAAKQQRINYVQNQMNYALEQFQRNPNDQEWWTEYEKLSKELDRLVPPAEEGTPAQSGEQAAPKKPVATPDPKEFLVKNDTTLKGAVNGLSALQMMFPEFSGPVIKDKVDRAIFIMSNSSDIPLLTKAQNFLTAFQSLATPPSSKEQFADLGRTLINYEAF